MLYATINKNKMSLSMMDEILGIEKVVLTISSNTDEIFVLLNDLQIPYKDKSIQEVLKFLFDRLLFESMEDQSYYTKESYSKFRNTFIYDQLQMLIYHIKSLMLWLYSDDLNQLPKNCKSLYRKKDINPVDETNYLGEYERFKMYMKIVSPNKLAEYFNNLVGLKHFSIRTKAIYHAFVEELELRDIDYDSMLYGKERMLSYYIDIVSQDDKLIIIKK